MSTSHLSIRPSYFITWKSPVNIARVDHLWKIVVFVVDCVKVTAEPESERRKKPQNLFIKMKIRNSIYLCKRFNLTGTVRYKLLGSHLFFHSPQKTCVANQQRARYKHDVLRAIGNTWFCNKHPSVDATSLWWRDDIYMSWVRFLWLGRRMF